MRKKWHQRRLERVGQDDGLVVSRLTQLHPEPMAIFQLQCAVRKRVDDDTMHLRYRAQQGLCPWRGKYIYLAVGMALFEASQHRLHQHGVADPAGPDNEYLVHCA
jgi:hypothetical protein